MVDAQNRFELMREVCRRRHQVQIEQGLRDACTAGLAAGPLATLERVVEVAAPDKIVLRKVLEEGLDGPAGLRCVIAFAPGLRAASRSTAGSSCRT